MMEKLFRSLIIGALLPLSVMAKPGNGALEFVANKGQWEGPFLYKAATGNGQVFLERNTFTYVIGAPENDTKIKDFKVGKSLAGILNYHAYKMVFEGGNVNTTVTESKLQQHYYNYFIGNDQTKWKSGIHPALALDYHNMYKNVDVHIASDGDNMKYDLIVNPGADVSKIRMKYVGATSLSLKAGKLVIGTTVGNVEELKPYAYQIINGERTEVTCKYKLDGETVTFSFPYGYDETQMLVIDPTVVFATFTGSSFDNWGYTATYDAAGNFYAGGVTSSASGGTGYPILPATGAIQSTYGGGSTTSGNGFPCDIAISKFNANGTALVYSTYLGGNDNEQPHSLYVDALGNLVIAGRSYSANFPTTPGCYDNTYNGKGDLVVTLFSSAGTALLGSTFVGGSEEDISNTTSSEFGWGGLKHNYGDDARSEVIMDNAGNIYIAACTKSPDFPTLNAIKTTLTSGDVQDGIVLKMNRALTTMLWSTYLGGSSDDAAYVLTLDNSQTQVFVAGGTASNNFPATAGTYQETAQGGIDGFIVRFQNGGSYALQKGTYIGRAGYDQCFGIQVDLANNVYTMGQTMGGTFPVTSGAYSNPGSSQFVMKLDNNLSSNLISTVYGSGNSSATNISPVAFLVDTCENVYISGWGGDIYSPTFTPPTGTGTTFGMPLSSAPNPPAQSTTDGADFYFIVFSKNLTSLLYSTFMGRSGGVPEHVDGGTSRFDRNGVVYQAICGACGGGSFPTTAGVYKPTNGSSNCNLVALKIAMNLGRVKSQFSISPNKICVGESITFTNTSSNAVSYEWDFGDGSPTFTGAAPPPKVYNTAGTFIIRLIAVNPSACNIRDTTSIVLTVSNNKIDAAFTATVIDTCAPYKASFVNSSSYSPTPAGTVFTWDFGDGSAPYTGVTPPNRSFPGAGTYTVKLIMTDPAACNSPDSATQTITFKNDSVLARFDVPPLNCISDSFRVTNKSINGATYKWYFGDGKTSTQSSGTHKYDTTGTYKVTLIAYNPLTCNRVDSISKTVTLYPSPTADFTYSPTVPETNVPYDFSNQSKNAITFSWNFGDGEGSQDINPSHTYKRSGNYNVCLIAFNKEGCSDTVCKPLTADVKPLADIPTGFSPNGDGKNDVLYVRGYGVQTVNLRIYNRWGQKVFETNDMEVGWDGSFNGKPQEMEAYGYVLNVTFTDGTSLSKKGNVTLLR